MLRFFVVLLCLFLINLPVTWSKSNTDNQLDLMAEISKGNELLEDFQFKKAFSHFHKVWRQTHGKKNLKGMAKKAYVKACEGLAWCYMYPADQSTDSIVYFLDLPKEKFPVELLDNEFGYIYARYFILVRNPKRAIQILEQLLSDSIQQSPDEKCRIWFHLGIAHFNLSKWDLAICAFEQSAKLGKSVPIIGRGNAYVCAHLEMARAYERLGNKYGSNAISALHQVEDFLSDKKKGFEKERLELKIRKSEIFLQKHGVKALGGLVDAIRQFERWLMEQDYNEEEEIFWQEYYGSLYSNAARCYLQLDEKYAAISYIEKGRNRLMNRQRTGNTQSANIRFDSIKLQKYLQMLDYPKYSTIVRYFQIEDSIYALVVFPEGDTLMTIRDTSLLENSLSRLFSLKGNMGKTQTKFGQLAYGIYRDFFSKIDHYLSRKQIKYLLIIPDGYLNLVPFDALYTQNRPTQAPYLLKKYAIWYAPGLSFLNSVKAPLHSKAIKWLGVAPHFDKGSSRYSNLKYNVREIKRVRRNIAGQVLVGQKAIKKTINSNYQGFSMLHFSSHGVLNAEGSSNLNHIVLDSIRGKWRDSLTVGNIKTLSFWNKDIVLSTCYAGLSRYISQSESMNSLSRGFLAQGAQSVLQSNWQLSEITSYIILAEYYEQLKQGKNQAEALQQAKLNYIGLGKEALSKKYKILSHELGDNYHLPYYWHTIVGFGVPHKVRFQNGFILFDTRWYWALISVFSIFVIGMFMFKYWRGFTKKSQK